MRKTTVYLPDDLKAALTRLARQRGCSEADLVREAIARLAAAAERPAPRLPLFRGAGEPVAGRVDDVLAEGFGVA